VYFWFI